MRTLARSLLLALAVVLAYAGFRYEHGLAHALGIDTQASQNYDFVSGVGPMIVTLAVSGGIFVTLWHSLNCHVDGCPRIARYHVAGQRFRVCRRHHPAEEVRDGKVSHHHILRAHARHEEEAR